MDGKEDMQADGGGKMPSGEDVDTRLDRGGGQSEGGAYPNPHTGKDSDKDGPDKFMGHGGQTDQAYYGEDQLGDDKLGRTDNSQTDSD